METPPCGHHGCLRAFIGLSLLRFMLIAATASLALLSVWVLVEVILRIWG